MSTYTNPPTGTSNSPPEFRTIGFPRSSDGATAAPGETKPSAAPRAAPPRPLPKRPKGRWFVSAVILSIVFFVSRTVWNEFLAFQAYGEIEGRVLTLSPIASGTLTSIHVRDGEFVQAGQLLAFLENHDLERERIKLRGDMAIALASLQVKIAEIDSFQQGRAAESLEREAEYYKRLGELHNKQAKLVELKHTYEQNLRLKESNAISDSEAILVQTSYEGLAAEITELESSLQKLRESVIDADQLSTSSLVQSELARLRSLQADMEKLCSFETAGEIRAPAAGRIIRRAHFTGEYVRPSDIVFELLEEGSLAAVLYVTQARGNQFQPGQVVDLMVQPYADPQSFVVSRIGERMVHPPISINRYYRTNQILLPVHVVPTTQTLSSSRHELLSWIGAEVALPTFGATRTTEQMPTNQDARTLAQRKRPAGI